MASISKLEAQMIHLLIEQSQDLSYPSNTQLMYGNSTKLSVDSFATNTGIYGMEELDLRADHSIVVNSPGFVASRVVNLVAHRIALGMQDVNAPSSIPCSLYAASELSITAHELAIGRIAFLGALFDSEGNPSLGAVKVSISCERVIFYRKLDEVDLFDRFIQSCLTNPKTEIERRYI